MIHDVGMVFKWQQFFIVVGKFTNDNVNACLPPPSLFVHFGVKQKEKMMINILY
jgi:hypothetical protein